MVGRKKIITRFLPWLVLVCYWVLLFICTHIPRIPSGMTIHVSDKFIHFMAFLCLTLLFWLAEYGSHRPSIRSRMTWLTVIMLAAYGVVDELTQHFVHRTVSFADWLSDLSGVLAALFMLFLMRRWSYWLAVYWLGLFIITHWPQPEPLLKLPDFLQKYHLVYYLVGYTALTILWWRSWCRQPRFMFSTGLMWSTTLVVGGYALIDQGLKYRMHRGFNEKELAVALLGLALGIGFSVLMARHHEIGQPDEMSQNHNPEEISD